MIGSRRKHTNLHGRPEVVDPMRSLSVGEASDVEFPRETAGSSHEDPDYELRQRGQLLQCASAELLFPDVSSLFKVPTRSRDPGDRRAYRQPSTRRVIHPKLS